jgi:hypothetical protein
VCRNEICENAVEDGSIFDFTQFRGAGKCEEQISTGMGPKNVYSLLQAGYLRETSSSQRIKSEFLRLKFSFAVTRLNKEIMISN